MNLVERNPNGQVSAFRAGRHESEDIVALAQQIQTADLAVRNTACSKLSLILEQIRFLQAQAVKILDETETHEQLHHAACNFRKIPGTTYHLYERPSSGQKYFSMLSPSDWGESFSHRYVGSYRLEADNSWTPADEIERKTAEQQWAQRLLDSNTKDRSRAVLSIVDSTPDKD